MLNILKQEWWRFEWRYWRKLTPWDTQITPPEVIAFLKEAAPGRALDLGCGTGTNAITLCEYGWQVIGVDFSPKAIATARSKAARRMLPIDFHMGDVADLHFINGPFDFALDVGCLFSLKPLDRKKYADALSSMLPRSARYMLYAWLPQIRRGRQVGITAQEVAALFLPNFTLDRTEVGRDGEGQSAWYWFTRR
jgi:SAM-dependent methyltransferase